MTEVNQSYSPDFNLSVTERDGKVVKVTTWVTGVDNSTRTVHV
jgi:hypothetical protein